MNQDNQINHYQPQTSSPPPPDQSSTPSPEPTSTRKPKAITLFFLLALIFALSATGYLFYQNNQIKQKLSQTQSSSPSSTETDINVTDWKTHADYGAGFSIKYPQTWYIEENTDFQKPSPIKDVLEVKVRFANFKPPFSGPAESIPKGCLFNILVADTTMSLDELINKNPSVGSLPELPDNEEKTQIDGRLAVKRIYSPDEKNTATKTTLYTSNNDKAFVFYYFSVLEKQTNSCEETFDQILSTFQFLD